VCSSDLRAQIEILAVEIEDIGAAVDESLAISALPNLLRPAIKVKLSKRTDANFS
jgi:hypothetical protein